MWLSDLRGVKLQALMVFSGLLSRKLGHEMDFFKVFIEGARVN